MKTNKTPEKIYLTTDGDNSFVFTQKRSDNKGVEYIRKDAFIEKACQFIKEHHHEFSFWNTEEYELGFSTQKFIKDFKKYMEDKL